MERCRWRVLGSNSDVNAFCYCVKRLEGDEIDVRFRNEGCFSFVVLLDSDLPSAMNSDYHWAYTHNLSFITECDPNPPPPAPIMAFTVDTPTLAADATMPRPISK